MLKSSLIITGRKFIVKYSTTVSASQRDLISLTFASPTKVLYNNYQIKQVDVPTFSGSIGILPQHVPTLAVLKPGVVTVFEPEGNIKKYFISSGSLTVNHDSSAEIYLLVQILAEEAAPVEHLDLNASRQLITDAQLKMSTAESNIMKTESLIALEVAEALAKAAEEVKR